MIAWFEVGNSEGKLAQLPLSNLQAASILSITKLSSSKLSIIPTKSKTTRFTRFTKQQHNCSVNTLTRAVLAQLHYKSLARAPAPRGPVLGQGLGQ